MRLVEEADYRDAWMVRQKRNMASGPACRTPELGHAGIAPRAGYYSKY
jgi:hypothetical protein